jgi:glycerophosphoryl diester phosphodiesterase
MNARRIGVLLLALFLHGCASAPFDVQGHRGARGLLPENTLPAFAKALELGVDTLELDVGVTRDGVVVIYHDRTLNADITRDASGAFLPERGAPIASFTFSQLQAYDVGRIAPASAYAKTFATQTAADGTRIPTLQSLFDLVAKSAHGATVRFNIETKLSPIAPTETLAPDAFADAVLNVVKQNNLQSRVSIQSFDWRTLQHIQKTEPSMATVYLSNEQGANETVRRGQPGASPWFAGFDVDANGGSVARTVKAAGGRVWSPNARDLTEVIVKDAQALGLSVIPWTVNDAQDMRRLMAWGVNGIITDYPDVLMRVVKEKAK